MPSDFTPCESPKKWMGLTVEELILANEVTDGPVLENVVTGPNVDLTMFPVPKFSPLDGGRWPVVMTLSGVLK